MMQRKLKEVASLFLCGLLLTVCISGCGNSVKTGGAGKVSISIGNWPNAEAKPKAYEVYTNKLKKFTDENPNIEIEPDEFQYDVRTFLPKAEGGTLPTVYATYFTEASKIIELGYAADITEALKKFGYYEKVNEYILEMISKNGQVYMIPNSCYSLGLVLNLDLFKEAGFMDVDETPKAPKTFDELISVARTITEKTGKPGFVFPTTDNAGGWNFTVLAWNFGTNFIEKVDGKWKATFNSKECIAALEYLKDLKWKYNVLPSNTLINNADVSKLIGTNQAAMAFFAPVNITGLVSNYGMSKDSIGFSPMPAGPARHVTLVGGDFRVLTPKATKEQINAAFKWLEYDNVTPNLTEATKATLKEYYELQVSRNLPLGLYDLSVWNEKSDIENYKKELINEMSNININHVRLFNEARDIEMQTEEPVCAQDLYGILDRCIQEVLTNENADCAELLKKAASSFQSNFLDYED